MPAINRLNATVGLSKKCLLLLLLLVFVACENDDDLDFREPSPATEYSAEVPLKWFTLFETIDRYSPGYRPPAAARAVAYIGLAGYEAAVHGMPENKSLAAHFPELQLPAPQPGVSYHWPTAVNAAYYTMYKSLYPHIRPIDQSRIESAFGNFDAQFAAQTDPGTHTRSLEFGKDIAEAVFLWSSTDEPGHDAYLDPTPGFYTPPQGPGLWQPTPPEYSPALFPQWGEVRTFAMGQSDLLAEPPLPWSEDPASLIYQEAKEVELTVDQILAGQDTEGRWIAEFWSDDFYELTLTPAGRWVSIANQVIRIESPRMDAVVELYAKLGMALCDAGIAIWYSKYHYNYERPIDYIRRNFDPEWTTIMNNPLTGQVGLSPNFPAYPSGHSGFGGAAAIVLTDQFGHNYSMVDNCHESRSEFLGTPRSFNSFTEMAIENAFSRIPLGVHFRMDCVEGLRQGYLAGERVLELSWEN